MVSLDRVQLPSIIDPVVAVVESPQRPADRISHLAQKSLFSDWVSVAISFPCALYRTIKVCVVNAITWVIDEANTLCFRVYALYLDTVDFLVNHPVTSDLFQWLVSFVIEDNNSAEKIDEAKKALYEKTRTSVYNETAKVLSKYLISYLRHSLDNALTMHATVRPKWVSTLLWQKPDGTLTYSLTGRLLCSFLQKNEGLVERAIELNVVNRISCFADIIRIVQHNKRFAFLDLLRGVIATTGKAHFLELNARAIHLAQHPPSEQERAHLEYERGVLQSRIMRSFDVIGEAFMKLLFPQGEKDIELPLVPMAAPYLQNFLFEMLKKEAVPAVACKGFTLGTTEYAKSMIMLEGFKLLGKLVDQEIHSDVPNNEVHYPHIAELAVALEDTLPEIFDYGDPNFIPTSISEIAQKKLACKTSQLMGEKLQTIPLQELVLLSLDRLLSALNDGGTWVVEEGQRRFQMQPFQFEITLDDKREKERRYQEKTELKKRELKEYVDGIGKTRQGIEQLFQYAIFGANSPLYATPQQNSSFWDKIADTYNRLTKQMTSKGLSQIGLVERIGRLNQSLLVKLMLPEHHKLFIEVTQAIFELLGEKAQFPDLRDPRYKKENN